MIAEYLDCSTAHLASETVDLLFNSSAIQRRADNWPAMTIAEYREGFFVTVPDFTLEGMDEQLLNLPHSLHQVLAHANSLNCRLVRLDADGDEIDSLPVYEW